MTRTGAVGAPRGGVKFIPRGGQRCEVSLSTNYREEVYLAEKSEYPPAKPTRHVAASRPRKVGWLVI